MSLSIVRVEATPNPNAIKCILSGVVSPTVRSFRNAAEAQSDPLAVALFAVDGVAGILMNGEWMTVNKRPDAPWAAVRAGVRRVLRDGG